MKAIELTLVKGIALTSPTEHQAFKSKRAFFFAQAQRDLAVAFMIDALATRRSSSPI